MRLKPNVALSGEKAFRDAEGVQASPGQVNGGHEQQPTEGRLGERRVHPLRYEVVAARDHPTTAERSEDACSQWFETAVGESFGKRNEYANQAQKQNERNVNQLWLNPTVKRIVEPRYKGAHDQQRDAHIVEFQKQFIDPFRVTVHCVKSGREGHTSDGTGQKGHKNKFFFQMEFVVRPGVNVGRYGQK